MLSSGVNSESIPENATQFMTGPDTSILDVVIGLDFGTSSTKVIIQVPQFTGQPAYAVPFGKFAHSSLRYLLPTQLAINEDGICTFPEDVSHSSIADFKVRLMYEAQSPIDTRAGRWSAVVLTTAYLALVLRYVRIWFLRSKRDIFGGYTIRWTFNLGLPAAIDDDPDLRNTFSTVGKAAWLAFEDQGAVTLDLADSSVAAVEGALNHEDDLSFDFGTVPEVVAQVTGYARSRARTEGLHFLVDIGASTLDLCAFILTEFSGDDHFSLLTAEVKLLGGHRLHLARVDGVKQAIEIYAEKLFDTKDPLSHIPEDLDQYMPSHEMFLREITNANSIFAEECKKVVQGTLWYTRTDRDPKAVAWSDKLPIFVCGGARSVEVYQEAISNVDPWLRRFVETCQGAKAVELPIPDSLDAQVDKETYHRLSVAWGLSHQSFNVGTYSRPQEIENTPRLLAKDIGEKFVSKDMV